MHSGAMHVKEGFNSILYTSIPVLVPSYLCGMDAIPYLFLDSYHRKPLIAHSSFCTAKYWNTVVTTSLLAGAADDGGNDAESEAEDVAEGGEEEEKWKHQLIAVTATT